MKLHHALAACAAGLVCGVCAPRSAAAVVEMNVFSFDFSTGGPMDPIVDPTISVGDTVRWTFLSPFHSVTSVAGIPEVFDSGVVTDFNVTFEHTFTNAGVWHYYCLPHGFDNGDGTAEGMAGTITVVPVPAPGAGALACVGALALARRRRP
jgi:plastocyanin